MKKNFDTLQQPNEVTQAAAFISTDQNTAQPETEISAGASVTPPKIEGLDFYTVEQVMALLQVTRRTMYNYIKAGQIDAVKIGRNWRIARGTLERFLAEGTTPDYYERLKS